MLTLDDDKRTTLQALFTAIDELSGMWPHISGSMEQFGIDDPDTAFDELRELAFNG